MNAKEILETALRNKYCNLKGATPSLTIYVALLRDIEAKDGSSRFVKTGRGLFVAR